MTSNLFKQAIQYGGKQVGLWLSLADPYAAELCAASSFDWLLIDCEHAPNDLRGLLHHLQAIAAYPVTPVVRLVNDNPDGIKQVLDLGIENIMIPMVSTAEQARRLVSAVRYPPKGRRGIGHALGRASRWNRDATYFDEWEDRACIIVQVETPEALTNLEDIMGVDGIDAMLIGPADLAASLGHPGDMGHPDVRAAIDDAIARTRAIGASAGILTIGEDAAFDYFAKGCSFVAAGVDVLLLAQGADALSQGLRRRLTDL